MLTVSSNVETQNHRRQSEERRRAESGEKPWDQNFQPRSRATPARTSSKQNLIGSRSFRLEDIDRVKLTWQQRLLLTLEEPSYSLTARVISYFMLLTICGTICFFVLEAEPDLADWEGWYALEIFSTAVFTIEYLLRFLVSNAFGSPTRLEFLRSPMNVLDVLAISPFYVELLSQSVAVGPLAVLRSVRLIRIFRIFRLSRYSMGMSIMIHSLVASVQPLIILLFFLCIGGTLFSSLVYYAEKMYCPDMQQFTEADFLIHRQECRLSYFDARGRRCCDEWGAAWEFRSIMDATWWCVVTMTTVGYGDKVPATKLGQFIGALTILSGIVLISLPVAIVGSRFQSAYEECELERQRLMLEEKDRTAALERQVSNPSSNGGMARMVSPGGMPRLVSPGGMPRMVSPEAMSKKSTDSKMRWNRTMSSNLRKQPSTKSRKSRGTTGTGSGSMDAVDSLEAQDTAIEETTEQLIRDLEHLRQTSNLTGATREQIRLLLALLEHLSSTEDKLKALKEKDSQIEARLSQSFSKLCRNYESLKRTEKTRTLATNS